MKRIIEGKMYNTETAVCVAKYAASQEEMESYNVPDGELYIKKTGEWFLFGNSESCRMFSDDYHANVCRDGGFVIIPFYEEEAKQWLADHNFVDEYIKYFGEPEE